MTREIKFRGKRVDNGEWVYGAFVPDVLETPDNDLITWGFIRRYNRDIGKMETIEVSRESVGQYTGLCDKNGKEIYEGDIIKYHPEANMGVGRVFYDNCSFYVSNDFDAYLGHFAVKGLEVIGNIYDNPELLEVEHGK